MLVFDPVHHAYSLDGRRLPNVTSILSPLVNYAGVPPDVLDAAAHRGNYVHKMCEMHLWDTLDRSSVFADYLGYLTAFERFLDETGFVAELVEERVYHKSLLYAGTLDLGGVLPGTGRTKDKFVLVDLKTTFRLMPAVGPQTAAYYDAWNSHRSKEWHFQGRYGLQLKPDGTYTLRPYTDLVDSNVFRSCLNIHNFMQTHK